jgi:3-oxoacyl-(acyl-carrier-protein) synthase
MNSPPARRVGITGVGFVTCIGNDAATVVENLRELRHGLATFEFMPGIELPVKVAGTIKDFETRSLHYADWRWPARYTFKRETLRSLPPHGLHALCAAEQAIAEARLSAADLRDDQTGLFTASAGSPFLQRAVVDLLHTSKGERVSPLGIVSSISGTLSFNLGAHYGIRGAVCGFSSACTSTAHALGYACDEIALGRLSRVLVIGGEDLTAESIYSFHGMRALSRNPDPDRASRPFDVDRDGFVGTGGAAAVLLENIDSARRRNAPIHAEMLGWGQASDGHNVAISDPDGRGLALSMRRALAAARIAPSDVDFVNAHATSTPIGDRSEARALHAVFTAAGATPAISSTKALTGHGLSMAAAMETGFCALALRHGFIPGQAHLVTPDPACAGLHLPATTISRAPDIVVKNSSGFGGSNVTLVLKRWSE